MAFAFRLQRLLRLRQQEERLCQLHLARVTQAWQAARRELTRRQTTLSDLEERFAQASARLDGWLDPASLALFSRRQHRLRQECAEAVVRVNEAAARVAQARQKVVAAAQRRRTLERLRTKAWLAYQQAELAQEHKTLDEVATVWHYRHQELG
ncbi:MAG: flagellar FliJ family protein [Limnochordaceae bacterium]|nr:flagellar FliJ family protein [Limnochordaceae bacterium]